MIEQMWGLIGVIESAGVPALRVAFTIVVVAFAVGLFIFRRRHQFFDRDPNAENELPVVRHNRLEEILFIWNGLMLLLIAILYQVWRA
jgi:hypothetical protein